MKKAAVPAIVLCIVVAGCAGGPALAPSSERASDRGSSAASSGATLERVRWRLVDLRGNPARAPEGAGQAPYLELDPDAQRVRGSTGCNRFTGSYQLEGESGLRFGAIAGTRRACLDPIATRQETQLLDALRDTRTWARTGSTLTLSSAAGSLARFRAE